MVETRFITKLQYVKLSYEMEEDAYSHTYILYTCVYIVCPISS
jgi:hypothetical protein